MIFRFRLGLVTPANAGAHTSHVRACMQWIPAFAGMTALGRWMIDGPLPLQTSL